MGRDASSALSMTGLNLTAASGKTRGAHRLSLVLLPPGVILSEAKDLSRWAHRCFAVLSMTGRRLPAACPVHARQKQPAARTSSPTPGSCAAEGDASWATLSWCE